MAILHREFRPNGPPDTIESTMLNNYQIEPILPIPFPLEPRNCLRPRLCVIIPVYNEEQVLSRTYSEISAVLDTIDVDWKILFVNDGSRDGTVAVLETLFRKDKRIDYLLLSRNFGHQAA